MTDKENIPIMKSMNKSAQMQKPADSKPPIVMQELPSMPSLLGKAAFKSGNYALGDQLPGLSTQINSLVIHRQHLQAYQQLCGFQRSETLPATYLHMLGFPLFLKILIQQDFPMRAMGQVHLRNQISVLHQFDLSQPINMTAAIGNSTLTSRGLEWNIDVSAIVDNQVVWTGESVFLHRCKTGVPREPVMPVRRDGEPESWWVGADIGRRYARVSGDYNPIHLTDITAKLFGFKQAIAHGMWSKARCLAALDQQLPAEGYSVDVTFHRPLFLPSQVLFYSQQREGKQRFSLFNQTAEQAHLEGTIT
jgi:acyl dehydratase